MSCPDCYKGSVHSHAGEAKGTTETINGKTCYVASPPVTSASKSVIIYLTDSFGLNLINAKLLSDRLATETGCKVLIPDVIPGGGGPVSIMAYSEIMQDKVDTWNIPGQLKRIGAALGWVFYSIPLAIRVLTWSSPQRAYKKNILPFTRAIKAELPPGAKLGIVGFCWGGYSSTNLCKELAVEGGSERLVDVQFCGHPYGLKTPDMIIDAVKTYKVPFCMAIGDKDHYFKKAKLEETLVAMRQKLGTGKGEDGNTYEVEVYDGCTHGFVVRANPSNSVETTAADEARAQAIAWLKKYL